MHHITTIANLRTTLAPHRLQGRSIGFVPTMGALHAGHMALVERSMAENDITIVSIFVNPTQFAPNEDFAAYPRQEAADFELLQNAGVDYVFTPGADEFYPEGFATTVTLTGPALGLETDFRPHFFAGVATVVSKLLNCVQPTRAYFGEKDYQQLLVIKHMVRDLNLPVVITPCPTLREIDGLAMSSRNAYLSPEMRVKAALIYKTLNDCAQNLRAGATVQDVLKAGVERLQSHGFAVDYLALRDAASLEPITNLTSPARLLVAARLGSVRLIDNIGV